MLDSRVELLVLGKSKNMKKKKNSPNPRVHHENKKVLWYHGVKESVIIFFFTLLSKYEALTTGPHNLHDEIDC